MEVVEGCGVSQVEYWRRGEERCRELELEIVRRKREYEALEVKFRALEAEKLAMEEEIRAALKRGSGEIKEKGNGDMDEDDLEEDKVFQLMVENEVLECEKKKAEKEVEAWKKKYKELETRVLECEKKKAEKEVEAWKKKYKELETRVLELTGRTESNEKIGVEDGLKVGVGMESSRSKDIAMNVVDLTSEYHSPGQRICNLQAAGVPNVHEHGDGTKQRKRSGVEYGRVSQARKQLEFKEDKSPCKKIAPPTPGGNRPFSLSVKDISDSDDELTNANNQKVLPTDNPGSRRVCISLDSLIGDLATKSFLKQALPEDNNQEFLDDYNEELLAFSTPKKKRASNVVTSDSESSDDNIPISRVKRMHLQKRKLDQAGSDVSVSLETATASMVDDAAPPKRRLGRLRKCGGTGQAQGNSSQTSQTKNDRGPNKDVKEDEPEEAESESEGESLGGFIVKDSDVSESIDASSESNCVSDDDVNFENVGSKLQRNKDHNRNWEFEADMLAAFGKDPELCMRAVCALYRQQTCEEKFSRGTLLYNSRGFSKFDALRGSKLAEFLTDGDPNGDLNKTVEELEEHDPEAIETCRTLATRYSKQLFEIYKNKEDPLFLPS